MALVYSARSADEFAFRAELEALAIAGRIATHFTVTREDERTGPAGAAASMQRC